MFISFYDSNIKTYIFVDLIGHWSAFTQQPARRWRWRGGRNGPEMLAFLQGKLVRGHFFWMQMLAGFYFL
jgi:hypothetical protein